MKTLRIWDGSFEVSARQNRRVRARQKAASRGTDRVVGRLVKLLSNIRADLEAFEGVGQFAGGHDESCGYVVVVVVKDAQKESRASFRASARVASLSPQLDLNL